MVPAPHALSETATLVYSGSSFLFLIISADLALLATIHCLPAGYASAARAVAIWFVGQTVLSYLGDSVEFLRVGHGPLGVLDRCVAVLSLIMCTALACLAYADGMLSSMTVASAGAVLLLAILFLVSGVVMLRVTGPCSAQERPVLWAALHSMWHLLATTSALLVTAGLRSSALVCTVSNSPLAVGATLGGAATVLGCVFWVCVVTGPSELRRVHTGVRDWQDCNMREGTVVTVEEA